MAAAWKEDAVASLSSTVPRPFDSFIGREEELLAVKTLLATHRLVTLTGPAGIGKTRLALRLAEELAASYADGVCFVPLVELTDPALLPQAVASALGLREQPDRSLLQTLTDSLASRAVLLVWDNCDYLVAGCRALAQALLGACPQVKILATSRRSLRVHGERLYTVPPFSVPEAALTAAGEPYSAEQILAYEAPRLFEERGGEILTGFTIRPEDAASVAQICRRLDGIPLAVELAAGRIRELSAQQIAARLDERFHLLTGGASSTTHQQTLRAAIDWSNELLSEAEQTLLTRLSVFAGGWDLGAAERVCSGGSVAERSVLDLLTGLIDKSWIVGETRQGVRRYRFLETIREYSQERLKAAGEEADLRARHGEFFLKLAEEAEAELSGSVRAAWLDRLESEYENLRAALAWCMAEENGAEMGVRLAGALVQFWEVRGYLSEGRSYLAEALGRAGAGRPHPPAVGTRPLRGYPERAKALNGAAVLAWMQGDSGAARALFEASLAIERTTGDRRGIAWSVHQLGHVASEHGDYEMARGLYEESLATFRELGDQPGIAASLANQGNMALKQGDHEAARSLYEESLGIARELGNRVSIAISLNNLGKIAREQGDFRAARALHAESLAIRRELGDKGGYPWSLEAFARLAAPGDPERAARLWGAAEALRQALGLPLPPNEREEYERHRAAAREALGEEAFAGAWAAGQAMTLEQATDYALRDDEEAGPGSRAAGEPCGGVPAAGAPLLPLPQPLTPFFGREAEISQVRAMLETPGARLVTLTGLGGTGKTRLALEVARLLQESGAGFAGVGFVSLADLTDPRLIGQTLREALNLPAAGAADPLEQIALHLADQPFLLVLDNFEQLLPESAATVQELLERSPRLVCLVTSRRPLGLEAEAEYSVAPLPTPAAPASPERLLEYASVRLFVSRAQAARSDFQVNAANAAAVAQLCQALEGIPLALELAAARAPVLTLAQMLQHLSDRFGFLAGHPRDVAERHRTLRAALEWSYQSLPESQQRLLARLSVFRGGCTLEAAAAVCGDGVGSWKLGVGGKAASPTPLLDELTEMQNASLVLAEEAGEAMRFRMLETVREYAAERLAEWGEAEAVRERHRDWYLELAERAEQEFDGPAFVTWLDRLEAERENLRAALSWCRLEEDGAEAGLRLAGALGRFWEVRGYLGEGRSYLAEALGRERAAGRPPGRAKALLWTGVLAHSQGDYGPATGHYEESLAISRQLADKDGIASVLNRLGILAQEQGDSAGARRFHEESLAIRRELGDPRGIALSLNYLGNVAREKGDYRAAKQWYGECLEIFRELGDRQGMCASRHLLGVVAEHEGDLALARSIYEECLPVWRELRFPVQVAWTTHGLGFVAYRQGEFPAARSRLLESLTLFREMQYTGGLVLSVERLGGLAVAQGQMQRAVRLLAAGASQRAATGAQAGLATQQEYEQDMAAVRAGLDAEAFEAAWAEGQAMTLQEAIKYALQKDEEPAPPLHRAAAADGAAALPPLTTKFALPTPSPNLLPRPRLTARLDPATRAHPGGPRHPGRLALLVASPGSGKSSLVSQWCQQQPEGSVAWLSLDREDNDPPRFLRYLCAALETVAPAAAAPARALLQAAERPSLEHVLTLLLNGVAALAQPVTLVLDDYHEIEATAVHHLLTFLVEHLPPPLFLILTTRSDPPLPLARLRLRGLLIEIRDEELRFTHEEATWFLNERMGLALPPEMVDRLAERTEGWIAGLQMAALSLQGEPDPSGFLDALAGSNRYLVDYLCEEVVQRQPPEVRTFLGQTAFLDRLCGPLCEAVTGAPGGQAMLERLEAAHLFLIPLDRERRWYRYHQLFADVLRARLLPENDQPLAALQERAAAWYEAEGMVEEAIEHALAGEQFERAARLIEREYDSVWRQDTWPTLERWLRALPPELIRTRPHLSLALAGLYTYSFRIAEAEEILNDCRFEPHEDTPPTRDLQGRLLMIRGWTARLRGDKERAARLMREALDLLAVDSHSFRSGALLNVGLLHEAGGDLAAAVEAFAAGVVEAQQAGQSVLRVRASYGAGRLRETQGALREAARLYHEALQYAGEQGILHTPAAALLTAALRHIGYLRNELPAAAYQAEGLECVRFAFADTNPMYAVPCCFELLRVGCALGDTTAADALFERLAGTARTLNVACLEPLLAVREVRRKAGEPRFGRGADSGPTARTGGAAGTLGRAPGPAAVTTAWLAAFEARTEGSALPPVPIPDLCLPDIRGLEIVTWAQLRLAGCPGTHAGTQAVGGGGGAQTTVVETRLEGFLEALVEQGRHGTLLEVRALLATLHWQGGRREQAVAVLEPALTLAAREGYVRIFVETGHALIPVLRQAAAQGIAPETVGKLLTALGEEPLPSGMPSASASLALAEPLSDRELEVLRLVAAGLANAEIAEQLFLAVGTVKRHVFNLYGKLGANSRTSAVARARELGLL